MDVAMHIGMLIKQKMEEQNKTVVWLAKQLSYTRANIYKLFNKKSIDTEVLFRISRALDFDFFTAYSNELKK